jgi:anti-sigma factor RsiW
MSMLGQRLRFRLDHRWVPEHISAYLDGELSTYGRARVERHTVRCSTCRRILQGVRQMLDLLRAQPPVREPALAQLVSQVRERLAEPDG